MSIPTPAAEAKGGAGLTTRRLAVAGILGGLTAVLANVPSLGFIPLPFSPAGAATTLHLPVIVAAVLEGPVVGAFVGFLFGLFSFLRAQASPLPFFKDPLIAFLPRILIGVVTHYAFVLAARRAHRAAAATLLGVFVARIAWESFRHLSAKSILVMPPAGWLVAALALGVGVAWVAHRGLRSESAPAVLAAVAGTLTNTVLVLALITLRFGQMLPPKAALFVGITHGLPEALVAVLITVPIVRAVQRTRRAQGA